MQMITADGIYGVGLTGALLVSHSIARTRVQDIVSHRKRPGHVFRRMVYCIPAVAKKMCVSLALLLGNWNGLTFRCGWRSESNDAAHKSAVLR